MMPNVFPLASTPTNLLLSHFPDLILELASGTFLAIDIIKAIVCSAAAPMFPDLGQSIQFSASSRFNHESRLGTHGEFTTMIPSFVAALTSAVAQCKGQHGLLTPIRKSKQP
jgi:hypothetical protein